MDSLEALLARIKFNPKKDRVWLAGDLINRGPRSNRVLSWARGLGDTATFVLGNHELHFLARYAGIRSRSTGDTLAPVLKKADQDLIDWLRCQPLIHEQYGYLMVHAGLLPRWEIKKARRRARAAEAGLQSEGWKDLLRAYYARDKVGPWAKEAETLRILCNIRMVDSAGKPMRKFKGSPESAPAGAKPWYIRTTEKSTPTFLFGHWAAHGFREIPQGFCLDDGCVWGGRLTALRLEDHQVFRVKAQEE